MFASTCRQSSLLQLHVFLLQALKVFLDVGFLTNGSLVQELLFLDFAVAQLDRALIVTVELFVAGLELEKPVPDFFAGRLEFLVEVLGPFGDDSRDGGVVSSEFAGTDFFFVEGLDFGRNLLAD